MQSGPAKKIAEPETSSDEVYINPLLNPIKYAAKEKIVPLIKAKETEFSQLKLALRKFETLKSAPNLQSILDSLTKTADTLLLQARTKHLMVLVDIAANHPFTFSNTDELKEKASVKAMWTYINTLINIENYKKLKDIFNELETFGTLTKEKQIQVLKSIDEKTLMNAITAENSQLDIDAIKKAIKEKAKVVCTELGLSENETNTLSDLFDKLITEYLPTININRQKLLEELPKFLATEKERLCKLHPELVVLEPKKSINILDRFKNSTQATKAAPRGKRALTPPSEEATVEEKPRGKCAPKKLRAESPK